MGPQSTRHMARPPHPGPLIRAAAALALLTLPGCASLPAGFPYLGRSPVATAVDAVTSTPPLDQVHWGILVVDAASGRILASRNAARKFVPASNMKLLTTATALSLLGPDYRYETSLWAVGETEASGGILDGDLVLHATGDPTFSERFYPSATAPLDSLADRVAATGLLKVRGSLVVDVSLWDSTSVPGSWMVGNLPWRSAATGGAFALGEGEIRVEVEGSDVPGEPARVRWWPVGDDAFLSPWIRTVSPDSQPRIEPRYLPESRRIVLSGQVPAGQVDTFRISQRDPVRQAALALARSLRSRGIVLEGGVRIVWDRWAPISGGCFAGGVPGCPYARRLASLRSPPLTEIVREVLEPSQNWIAEQLVRTLGAERGNEGSWEEGLRVERDFLLLRVGIDSLDLALRDGSGLSAYNLVTPRALVRLLLYMDRSPHGRIFREALASPGEDDSTLERRLPRLRGRLWAKTGTITHVNALSGYLRTPEGRELVFSILTNGSGLPPSTVRAGVDRIVEAALR